MKGIHRLLRQLSNRSICIRETKGWSWEDWLRWGIKDSFDISLLKTRFNLTTLGVFSWEGCGMWTLAGCHLLLLSKCEKYHPDQEMPSFICQTTHCRRKFIDRGASKRSPEKVNPPEQVLLSQYGSLKSLSLAILFCPKKIGRSANVVFFTSALFSLWSVVLQFKVVTTGLSLLLHLAHLHPCRPHPPNHHWTRPRLCHSAPPSLSSKEVSWCYTAIQNTTFVVWYLKTQMQQW